MEQLKLFNKYEKITFDKLTKAVEDNTNVFAKVRLADVFKISGSGISDAEYSYCLKAHFDFLITDIDSNPLFCVEYDGKQHRHDQNQYKKDQMKNELCNKFKLPILRINSKYIGRNYKGMDLLTYFIEVWFLERAFLDAQRKGAIPLEEDFDPCLFFSDSKGRSWPYWISSDIQLKIQKLYRSNKINQSAPSHWIGIDQEGNYRCICWIEINENVVIFVKTGMRKQLFDAVHLADLLSMLAIFDLDLELDSYFSEKSSGHDQNYFKSQLTQFTSGLRAAQSFTAGRISHPVI